VPFYNAPVKLVTVLQLTTTPAPMFTPREDSIQSSPSENDDSRKKRSMSEAPVLSTDAAPDTKKNSSDSSEPVRYWIQSQNDLYQNTEWIKFLVPWGLGVFLMILWQFYATLLCVAGVLAFDALVWVPKRLYRLHVEFFDNDNKKHPHLGAD
jgi:hypothetical protein